jgi:hypothetical protein
LVLRLNQETVDDIILLFMPPCRPHLTPLATGSLERSLLVFSTPGGLTGDDLSRLFFTCTNHQSSRNLHLQYLAKNQSTQRCQSLITQGSDHPSILEPHMVLTSQAGQEVMMIEVDWRQPFIDYIREQKVPTDKNLAEQIIRRAKSYVLVGDKLYRRGATSGVPMKCVPREEGKHL